ncbi:hypothetical protein GNI_147180 [Gregarina niphandrodes]|uniref:Uncharacterized protein n=1 Tax=Gregarina niphandrodes TaxID=110365 RepID=A0A023AZW0_GRENI|nr:hypothetical protein GNI_147180 [Gregarina niphandrodes]EZG44456.1 hypothetical protein GNI_147180 [Gregarina niphandrodes]|eukprot:XP_011134176.1 hypothetical protein GNI_147180 [Gregarina niphandrodes]
MKGLGCVGRKGRGALLASLLVDGVRPSTDGCVARMITIGSVDEAKRAAGAVVEVAVIAPPEKFAAASDDPTKFDWMMDAHRLHVYRETRATKPSRCVERLMGHSLEQYLEWEKATVADEICEEAFGVNLPQLLSDLFDRDNDQQLSAVPWSPPQTYGIRQLSADERVHLYARMPADWQSVLDNSSDSDLEDDMEDDDLEVGGKVGLCHLSFRKPYLPQLNLPRLSLFSSADIRQLKLRDLGACCTSRGVLLCLAAAAVTGTVVGGSVIAFSGSTGEGVSVDDAESARTRDLLKEVRVREDICALFWNDLALRTATPAMYDSWRGAPWCNGYSGRLVCGSTATLSELTAKAIANAKTVDAELTRGLSCYNFRSPFKHDLPTVWEAVVRHDAPELCAVVCDTLSTTLQRRGRYLAKKFDIKGAGKKANRIDEEVLGQFTHNKNCSRAYVVSQLSPADPQCNCTVGILNCFARYRGGVEIRWGDLIDFETNEEQLSKHVSGYHREGYKINRCDFECFEK